MRSNIRQFAKRPWPVSTGPIVVYAQGKNSVKSTIIFVKDHNFSYSRDGPIIFHMRDGPPDITGPPDGIWQTCGPPRNRFDLARGSSPPTTGPPMEWLVRKKTLMRLQI